MYRFIREDNGETIEVDFETHMSQDVAGYITLPDGVRARRVNDFDRKKAAFEPGNANHTPPVSDNLGFTSHQLAEFEADRVKHGFRGVEFKPDPACPTFYQVHFGSFAERDRYMEHRRFYDKNKSSGAALSEQHLAEAEKWAKSLIFE